jgi:adenylate cyclase
VAVAAGLLVARAVRRPIERIVDVSGEIAGGNLNARVALARRDEFGVMGRRFDDMAVKLEEREHIRRVFGRYVSEDVARKVLSSPDASRLGGEEREVTVLFNDLRGYSTVTEGIAPIETIQLLNEYMGAMGTIIDAHHGCVLEFIGDAIVAVFNAPAEVPDHAEKAVRCARAMVARLGELNRTWEASGLAKLWQGRGMKELGARIGVHTGRVVAGTLGTSTRVKYGVIGDTVNVTARVESLNKDLGTELLVTRETWARLPDDLTAAGKPRGEHPVKGRQASVTVYSF